MMQKECQAAFHLVLVAVCVLQGPVFVHLKVIWCGVPIEVLAAMAAPGITKNIY